MLEKRRGKRKKPSAISKTCGANYAVNGAQALSELTPAFPTREGCEASAQLSQSTGDKQFWHLVIFENNPAHCCHKLGIVKDGKSLSPPQNRKKSPPRVQDQFRTQAFCYEMQPVQD